MSHHKLKTGDKAHDFDFQAPWSQWQNFYEVARNKPAVLVFLRYQGCPVCQMEMAQLKREIGLFRQKEIKVFVFLQSSPATVASITNEEDWPFYIVCDPSGAIFQKYAVGAGGILKYLHPTGLISAIKAISQGFRHGKFEGKETQLPAAFVVNSIKIITYAYYGKHVSDLPSPATLAANIESESNPTPEEILALLRGCRTIAVVGLSDRFYRASYRVASYLKKKGYRIIPVNPAKNEILGEKCYPDLSSIPEPVDIVNIFRSVDAIPGIVEEAIRIKARAIWMQLGLTHNESAAKARLAGMCVIQSQCLMVEHNKLLSQIK